MTDDQLMRRALVLAARGRGTTRPNPMVGCVIARGGTIIAEGWHRRAGGDHAEIDALRKLGFRARGTTAYVTLEPCDHTGRTGPCTLALIEAGVKRVVYGLRDPNPRVDGRGARRLRAAGVEVEGGLLARESALLDRAWLKWITTKRPWVTLKAAVTLDGKLATRTGDSKWITSEASRKEAHRLRATHDAILVGAGTVIADDPALDVRHVRGRDPVRVILDGRLRSPKTAKALPEAIVYTSRAGTLPGAQVVRMPGTQVDLGAMLDELGAREVTSLLVEGGSTVHGAFLRAGLVDEIAVFIAPKLIGGDGLPLLGGEGHASMKDVHALHEVTHERLGDDVLVRGLLRPIR